MKTVFAVLLRRPSPLAGCAAALPASDGVLPTSLAAAETAFAAHSVREDMRAAFLAKFADDGVFVREGAWIVSNDFLRDRPAPPSCSTGGPHTSRSRAPASWACRRAPGRSPARRTRDRRRPTGSTSPSGGAQPGGPWKVAVDLGISNPSDSLWNEPLVARPAPIAPASSADGLAQAEARFAKAVAAGGAQAGYAAFGAAQLRYYRSGHGPIASRKAALDSPAMGKERFVYTVERSETARSGDFGYARGRYAEGAAPEKPLGAFLRVWRLEAEGWRIVLDVVG